MSEEVAPTALPIGHPRAWPPILTIADLAALLGLQSERAAREFVAREGVPCVRKGKRILVLLDSLLAWMKANETKDDRAARVLSAADRLRGRQRTVTPAALCRATSPRETL